MLWHIYLRNEKAYIPTVAQTEAGFYLDVEPVSVALASDSKAVQSTIKEAIKRGNPIVPAPSRSSFPRPVVLKYANLKSWSAFEREASCWTITEKDGCFEIKGALKAASGGWR